MVSDVQPKEKKTLHMSVFVVPHAIISLIPILKRPPVSGTPAECVAGHPDTRLTVVDHGDVFLLGGAYQRISPIELKALTTMQIQQFIWVMIKLWSLVDRWDGDRGKRACDKLV